MGRPRCVGTRRRTSISPEKQQAPTRREIRSTSNTRPFRSHTMRPLAVIRDSVMQSSSRAEFPPIVATFPICSAGNSDCSDRFPVDLYHEHSKAQPVFQHSTRFKFFGSSRVMRSSSHREVPATRCASRPTPILHVIDGTSAWRETPMLGCFFG